MSWVEQGRSRNGGWSRAQLAVIDVPWPPLKGWKARTENQAHPRGIIDKFIALKDKHLVTKQPRL